MRIRSITIILEPSANETLEVRRLEFDRVNKRWTAETLTDKGTEAPDTQGLYAGEIKLAGEIDKLRSTLVF